MYLSIYPPGPDGGHGGGDGARRHQHAAEAAAGRGRLRRATGARRPAGATGAQKQVVMTPRIYFAVRTTPPHDTVVISDFFAPSTFWQPATFL